MSGSPLGSFQAFTSVPTTTFSLTRGKPCRTPPEFLIVDSLKARESSLLLDQETSNRSHAVMRQAPRGRASGRSPLCNLAPANLKKNSNGFDLPILAGIAGGHRPDRGRPARERLRPGTFVRLCSGSIGGAWEKLRPGTFVLDASADPNLRQGNEILPEIAHAVARTP